ncbi:MAG: hypothetical protein AAFQ66_02190 [Pseudomonadota bacterium]
MVDTIKSLLRRKDTTLMSDAAGVAALVLLLVVTLHVPAFV